MLNDPTLITLLSLSLIFFLVSLFLTGFQATLYFLGKFFVEDFFSRNRYRFFFLHSLLKKFFRNKEWEGLTICLSLTRLIFRSLFITTSFLLALTFAEQKLPLLPYRSLLLIPISIILILLLSDFFIRLCSIFSPQATLRFYSWISSLPLMLLFPLTSLFAKVLSLLQKGKLKASLPAKTFSSKEKVIKMLDDIGFSKYFDFYDQKLAASLITFREKVAREIMVPRVNLCALPSKMTIREAAKIFVKEGYSRIPVFEENLDTIQGVLMYKDVIEIFLLDEEEDHKDLLMTPIESMIKPVIYCPENKKISFLFQEFRSKQIHLAIIVNEYGGTEGIVTIEDILEELVGEIEDEYDKDEERQYWKLPNGSWIVDAKMTIIDLESKLNITIPHHPEYETIGGYIFYRVGSIPEKGWKIHLDDYELEVLISNERCIEKVRITSLDSKSL